MIRGMYPCKCTECGYRFMAADIEWRATAASMPVRCPKCGSLETRHAGISGLLWMLRQKGKK